MVPDHGHRRDDEVMPWDSTDPAETVRLAARFFATMLGTYGDGMPSQVTGAQAAEVLETVSSLLCGLADDLRSAEKRQGVAQEEDAPDLLTPRIRRTFEEECAPADAAVLELAICDYKIAHLAIPGVTEDFHAWDDPDAPRPPSPAAVRGDIQKVLKSGRSFRDAISAASGEAVGRIGLPASRAKGVTGFARAVLANVDELLGYAETALVELGDGAGPGRNVSAKTRLALCLADGLAASGVPVLVDGKPSAEWAIAYDLALESVGHGPCPHAKKTLSNAIEVRIKERARKECAASAGIVPEDLQTKG